MSDLPLPPIGQTLPAAPPPPRRSAIQNLFFNEIELRAGWRVLIFFGIIWGIFKALASLAARSSGPQSAPPEINNQFLLRGEGFSFLIFLLITLLMSRIEHRPLRVYGLPLREAFGPKFWVGTLWGFASLTMMLLVLRLFHAFYFGHRILHGQRVFQYALLLAIGFVLVGLAEEYLVRAYAQFTLTIGIGFWPAAVVTSLIFAKLHFNNPGENWLGLFQVFLIGMFFCLTLRRTGSLWWAVGYHAGWDWSQSYLYGTPDSGMLAHGRLMASSHAGPDWLSGGSVGPEGSVLTILIYAAVVVLFHLIYKGVKYPDPAGLKTVSAEPAPVITPSA